MTKNAKRVRWVLAAAALAAATGTAGAAFDGPCGAELTAVEAEILAATFTNTSDQTNLLVKLANADAKIDFGKFLGAIDKLADISDAATALAASAKHKLDDATGINAEVLEAIGCVRTLLETSTAN